MGLLYSRCTLMDVHASGCPWAVGFVVKVRPFRRSVADRLGVSNYTFLSSHFSAFKFLSWGRRFKSNDRHSCILQFILLQPSPLCSCNILTRVLCVCLTHSFFNNCKLNFASSHLNIAAFESHLWPAKRTSYQAFMASIAFSMGEEPVQIYQRTPSCCQVAPGYERNLVRCVNVHLDYNLCAVNRM